MRKILQVFYLAVAAFFLPCFCVASGALACWLSEALRYWDLPFQPWEEIIISPLTVFEFPDDEVERMDHLIITTSSDDVWVRYRK